MLECVKKAALDAGMTNKDLYLSLGYDAPRWTRINSLEEHISLYRVASVHNAKFQIAWISNYMFEVVKLTATEIADDVKGKVA